MKGSHPRNTTTYLDEQGYQAVMAHSAGPRAVGRAGVTGTHWVWGADRVVEAAQVEAVP